MAGILEGRVISPQTARRLSAWLPAIILPAATADQLLTAVSSRSSENLSAFTWFLFLLANLGALALGRTDTALAKLQVFLAFGLTAILDVLLIAAIFALR
jgi:hypothetical protein